MNRKLSSAILSILLVGFVQGCWAVDTSTIGRKSDETMDVSSNIKVIEEKSTQNPKWCGNDAVIYYLPSGKTDGLGHVIYSLLYWANINIKESKKLLEDVKSSICSPDGQWLFYKKEHDGSLWRLNIASGDIFKIVDKGSIASLSPDNKKLIIYNHSRKIENIFISEKVSTGPELELLYFNESYNPGSWIKGTNSILIRGKEYKKFGRFDFESEKFEYFSEEKYFKNGFSDMKERKLTESGVLFVFHGKTLLLKCNFEDSVNLICNEFLPTSIKANAYAINPDGRRVYYYPEERQGIMVYDTDKKISSLLIPGGSFRPSSRLENVFSNDGRYFLHYYFGKLSVTRID